MATYTPGIPDTADAVVVGGGTIGAWCAWFLRKAGLERVVLVEKGVLGQGASSRAAGVVRLQGGTPEAVRLGIWSRRFYLSQREELGTDSGFVTQGYLLPCFTTPEVEAARERLAMQSAFGIGACWLDRNVAAYTAALLSSGVIVAERVAFRGLLAAGGLVRGVRTSDGEVHAPIVVLTGGPKLAQVGALAGIRIPAGGVRHQVAVTEQHPDLHPSRVPMVFDLSAGLYWRPEEGGLLFGMSNPAEPPGENRSVDLEYLARMRTRLEILVPVTAGLGLRRLWAATIDYTPDHLPIIGPAADRDGPLAGVTVASAGGAGMMWGPGVARAAADVALTGASDVVDTTRLGLDRFDEQGHSKLAADPVALPFPDTAPGRLTVS